MAFNFTPEEKDKLALAFEHLQVRPKFDDPEDLAKWLKVFAAAGSKDEPSDDTTQKVQTTKSQHRVYVNPPRIAVFSGSSDPKEISYESWKYEVRTLIREGAHSRAEVATAAKKSLRGEAALTVRHLGIDTDLGEILKKLDGIYGLVENAEDLMEKFYAAKQQQSESVATWSCRLEDLLYRASLQKQLPGSANDMLASKFFSGLQKHLKEPARVKTEHIKDFDTLRVEVRKIECELSQDSPVMKPQKAQLKQTAAETDDDIKAVLQQISSRLDNLESGISGKPSQQPVSQQYPQSGGRHQGRGHHRGSDRGSGRGSGRGRRPQGRNQRSYDSRWTPPTTTPSQSDDHNEPTCHRCGQLGHLAYGCRVDLSKKNLNWGESV